MTPAHPPRGKGAERKALILDAALRLIGRDGLGALSMRALAAEAGVPLGALGYYFPNKRAIIAEAFGAHSEREVQRVGRLISSIGDAGTPIDFAAGLARFTIDGLSGSQLALVAEYEYILEASRRPDLARASTLWQQTLHVLLTEVVARLGAVDASTDARLVMAVMAGLEVDNLTGTAPTAEQAEMIERTMARLVESLSRAWELSDPGSPSSPSARR